MKILPRSSELKNGFTLIEMLVVMMIMTSMVVLSLVGLQGARASSRDAQRKTDLQDIRSALEIYRADCGSYPSSLTFGSALPGVGAKCSANTYMSKVPQDPQNDQSFKYEYYYDSSTKKYSLCSSLEHASGFGVSCGGVTAKSCKTGYNARCFYSVTSP